MLVNELLDLLFQFLQDVTRLVPKDADLLLQVFDLLFKLRLLLTVPQCFLLLLGPCPLQLFLEISYALL